MIQALALLAAIFSADCPPEHGIETARLYRVTPGNRVVFQRTSDCRDALCSERAYVVPDDRVIVYASADGRSCALFARTETNGWLDSNRLAPDVAAAHPAPSAWVGDWYDGDDHIRLTAVGVGRMRVDGDAYWPAANPGRDYPSGPNIGQLEGVARVTVDRLDYAYGDEPTACRATLRLVGDTLLVDDNDNCGGINVRFTGTYRRRSAHRPATRS